LNYYKRSSLPPPTPVEAIVSLQERGGEESEVEEQDQREEVEKDQEFVPRTGNVACQADCAGLVS
jgi:hypothetical protein